MMLAPHCHQGASVPSHHPSKVGDKALIAYLAYQFHAPSALLRRVSWQNSTNSVASIHLLQLAQLHLTWVLPHQWSGSSHPCPLRYFISNGSIAVCIAACVCGPSALCGWMLTPHCHQGAKRAKSPHAFYGGLKSTACLPGLPVPHPLSSAATGVLVVQYELDSLSSHLGYIPDPVTI